MEVESVHTHRLVSRVGKVNQYVLLFVKTKTIIHKVKFK